MLFVYIAYMVLLVDLLSVKDFNYLKLDFLLT